jgi:hypothetical protein
MMKLLRSYIFWSHERGSLHYDVMVTAILLFIFVAPRFIDFKDKPAPPVVLHGDQVLVKATRTDGDRTRLVYEVRADDLRGATSDADRRTALLRMIEPISGDVTLLGYQPVMDVHNKVAAWDATVER